jgi:hypothetical protein
MVRAAASIGLIRSTIVSGLMQASAAAIAGRFFGKMSRDKAARRAGVK